MPTARYAQQGSVPLAPILINIRVAPSLLSIHICQVIDVICAGRSFHLRCRWCWHRWLHSRWGSWARALLLALLPGSLRLSFGLPGACHHLPVLAAAAVAARSGGL